MAVSVENAEALARSPVVVTQHDWIVETVFTPHAMPRNIRVMQQKQRPTIVGLCCVAPSAGTLAL